MPATPAVASSLARRFIALPVKKGRIGRVVAGHTEAQGGDELSAMFDLLQGMHIFPHDRAVRGDLQNPSRRGFVDEGMAVGHPLLAAPYGTVERVVVLALEGPDDASGRRNDFEHAGLAVRRQSALIVEQQDIAVRQYLGIVLSPPAAAQRPYD